MIASTASSSSYSRCSFMVFFSHLVNLVLDSRYLIPSTVALVINVTTFNSGIVLHKITSISLPLLKIIYAYAIVRKP